MIKEIIRGIISGASFNVGGRIIESTIEKIKEKKEDLKKKKVKKEGTILQFRLKDEDPDKKTS